MLDRRYHLAALSLGLFVGTSIVAVSAVAEDATKGARQTVAANTYQGSVESMIDRRREALENRRDNYRDAITGRRWRQAPWVTYRQDLVEREREAMNEVFRQRHDSMERRRDMWGRWAHPWSQWREDLIDARRNAYDLARLQRDEYFDRHHYGQPSGPLGPWY